MSPTKEKLEELRRKVLKAFADVPYPKGKIAPHECDECSEVSEIFANLNWKTINSEIIEEHHGSMSLFSPEAFNYFLPAYLIYSLKHFSENETVCEFTIYALTPIVERIEEKEEKQVEFLSNKFQKFTKEQINCIYEFLDFVREDEKFYFFFEMIDKGKQNLKQFVEPILRNDL